jgi:hypothetical protein
LSGLVWLPIGKPPDQLVDLQSAVERVVAAKYGVGFVAEWTPATLRGEQEAQAYGGVRTLAWEQARAWIREHLQRGELQLLKVPKADPPVIRAASADFWRSSDHDDIQRQRQILDRRDDPTGKWTYALDAACLMALLQGSFPTDENEHTVRDAPVALPSSAQPIDERPQRGNALKSPQAFVRDFFIAAGFKGRIPTIVECERAWATAGGRGHREDVRNAARQELEKTGNRVRAGRPRNSPK